MGIKQQIRHFSSASSQKRKTLKQWAVAWLTEWVWCSHHIFSYTRIFLKLARLSKILVAVSKIGNCRHGLKVMLLYALISLTSYRMVNTIIKWKKFLLTRSTTYGNAHVRSGRSQGMQLRMFVFLTFHLGLVLKTSVFLLSSS